MNPLTAEDDPIEIILAFANQIRQARLAKDPTPLNDPDAWLVTLVLSLITDPSHHVGKVIGRQCFKTWIERGGKVPKQGTIARTMKEEDQFEFAVQYLYDAGVKVSDIAMALGACVPTIWNVLKFVDEQDQVLKESALSWRKRMNYRVFKTKRFLMACGGGQPIFRYWPSIRPTHYDPRWGLWGFNVCWLGVDAMFCFGEDKKGLYKDC